ncbi:MAG: class I SAM-dependent methyltransferase [Burkholderiales bacterium]
MIELPIVLKQYLKNPRQVGAVTPSSAALAKAMLRGISWDKMGRIVEFGPGTGAITRAILDRLPDADQLVAVETNPVFREHLRRAYPGVRIIPDAAANLSHHLPHMHLGVDLIVSGLPFALMTDAALENTVEVASRFLRRGGHFRTFAYAHSYWLPKLSLLRRRLKRSFRVIDTETIWANCPPAVVLRCVK